MKPRFPLLLAALVAAPLFAQLDLSGEWNNIFDEDQPERIPGPEIGDYLGLPINDAARMRGEIWDASILTVPEHQCKPHPSDYGIRGPALLRISKELDPETQQVIAWRTHISWMAPERTIWMDGRPQPPDYAPHTWQGFSTGKWDGDILTVTTTHLKIGWIRRNGIPRSDRATVTEHFIRHDRHLTVVTIVDDPVYLTEPFLRSTDFVLDLNQQIPPYPCESVEEVVREKGKIPHYLPGANAFLSEFPNRFKLPILAARGGAGTMYPEYGKVIHDPSSHKVEEQTGSPRSAPKPNLDAEEIRVLPVQKSAQSEVYMALGPGGNTAVQVGKDGILVVDSQYARSAERLIAEIKKLSSKPIRYVLNTSVDEAHTGGNEALSKAGSTITGGNVAAANAGWPAAILAQENVLERMSAPSSGAGGGSAATPSGGWPMDIYREDHKDLYFNGEAVQLLHQPAAHTDGDSIVFFRKSDVIATGDVFTPASYPVIDIARGGSINGIVDALNRIIDLTVPAEKQEGGTMVIPGHGRLCDEADVVEYRDMMTIIRDRIRDLVKKGMTLEQVKAMRPTRDYDPLYGATVGPWTTDMFVEAAYKSLK